MTLVHFEDVMAAHSSFTTSLEAQMTHDDVIDNTGSTEAASIIGRFSTHMRAAAIENFGPPEELRVHRLQRPVPKSGEVVVQVISAGVQPTDAAIRTGWTPPGVTVRFPQVLGNEFSGLVAEVGSEVTDIEVGDAVLGCNILGCYAEYVAVDRTHVVPQTRWCRLACCRSFVRVRADRARCLRRAVDRRGRDGTRSRCRRWSRNCIHTTGCKHRRDGHRHGKQTHP